MPSGEAAKTIVQCDFDGTITIGDVSFMLLDAFAAGDWRQILKEYREDKIPVGIFNSRAFAMVKASRASLVAYMRERVKIRPGLPELLASCRHRGFRFVIVSNGLEFYIETILSDLGINGIEVHAARTLFHPQGIEASYVGPEGNILEGGFKDVYTRLFLSQGYHVIYIGDGLSDFTAAKLAHRVFAVDSLYDRCKQENLGCATFVNLADIAGEIALL
ncbi:MAG: MtnX-like HAD-IB family phosphatase [Chloroflexota bacterium]